MTAVLVRWWRLPQPGDLLVCLAKLLKENLLIARIAFDVKQQFWIFSERFI